MQRGCLDCGHDTSSRFAQISARITASATNSE